MPTEVESPKGHFGGHVGGVRLTDRDMSMLHWLGRHGVVTAEQVTRRFFARDGGALGYSAAARRVRRLIGLGLVRRDHTFYKEPSVLRLTTQGARLADAGVGPAPLVLSQVRHTLAVVDLVEALGSGIPDFVLTTERELRAERRRALATNTRRPGIGRIPDAVFSTPDRRIAIELDLTAKRSHEFGRLLRRYAQEDYTAVWWYVLPRVVLRLRRVVEQHRSDDLVTVLPWHGRRRKRPSR